MGASDSRKPPTDDVERFLSLLRFESKGKIEDLGIDRDYLSTLKMK
jgi:hypothetical protein